jgi:hypothetical protein
MPEVITLSSCRQEKHLQQRIFCRQEYSDLFLIVMAECVGEGSISAKLWQIIKLIRH